MAEHPNIKTNHRWPSLAALLLLCFLLAIEAMRNDLFPSPASSSSPHFEREALPFAFLATLAGIYSIARKAAWPRPPLLLRTTLISIALFAVPSLFVTLAQSWLSAFTRVVLFSLTPIFAVVFEPYIGNTSDSKIGTTLIPALVSLIGILCVFPVDIPNSIQAAAAFLAIIFAAAIVAGASCHAARLARELPPSSLAPIAAISAATAALALIVTAALTQSPMPTLSGILHNLPWSACITLPALLLLFWLMPRISATRITTRFLLAPFFAILISMAIDRPSVAPRIWLGLALIAAGAAALLFAPNPDSDTSTSTLNLNRE